MIAAALIGFREGLEAALIVGIVLGYLRKINQTKRYQDVWLGVALAVGFSIALAWGLQRLELELEGRMEEIFEGATMFLAVLVLTWMIYWMRYQARLIKSSLERNVQRALDAGDRRGLATIAFVAVFREGVETALFFTAAAFAIEGEEVLVGLILSLASAIALGVALYASTTRLEVRWFFNITSVLLLIFAAGLFAHGIHEFQEAAILPTIYPDVWDVNHILDENSFLGELLKSLTGYNGNPSFMEVLAYVGYWVFTILGIRWLVERNLTRRPDLANP